MDEIFFPVSIGDTVVINPSYYGNGRGFISPYKENGADHEYTITSIRPDPNCPSERFYIRLDGMDHGFTNEYRFLFPVRSDLAINTEAVGCLF